VVECDLAKVEVAGSNPVSRSSISAAHQLVFHTFRTCALARFLVSIFVSVTGRWDLESLQTTLVSHPLFGHR
jgi:hypothetical protein